ncbi:facilitated glucose transporter protein 1 [Drosophila rhopaloa]|uniref:Facilitated glucose transporter protein 1 n=1 Tax=Drosophila rhopaloa TaxID=1041015 RepID=A0A6P4E925_DRORH|nr:facilitated glucose transporter protein 1 [Drosophila rhopaloa]
MESEGNGPDYKQASVGFAPAPQQPGYPQVGYPQPGYPPPGYPQPGFHQPGYPQPGNSWNPPQPGFSGYPPPPHHGYPPQYYGAPPGYGATAPPPLPPPPPFAPQQTTTVVANTTWYSRNQKNKPQSNAVGAASLIFISGGMNIAWSIGFHGKLYYHTSTHNFVAWFIGAIIGAFLSCFLTNKIAKKHVVIFSSILVMIGGIVNASTRMNGDAALAGSYLDGIANGLVFAPFMALTGEICVSTMRGLMAASIEQMCFGLGIFVQIIYSSSWNASTSYPPRNSFSAENMKGVLSIIYGLFALIIGSLLCIESPVIMLAKYNDEQGAIDALRRLQRPYTLTNETFEQLAEHKRYLAQNKELSLGQSILQAIPTFIRLAFLRGLNAMSISSFVFFTLLFSARTQYGNVSVGWLIGFGVCRWMGNFIATFCMESGGRKKFTLVGLFLCSVLAFIIAGQYNIYSYQYYTGNTIMLLVLEFFAGIAFTATSPYLTEAYPLGVKQHFIAFTFIVEMLVFILLATITWDVSAGAIYFYVLGGLYMFGSFFGILCLPETRRMTLREAQEKFSRFINIAF